MKIDAVLARHPWPWRVVRAGNLPYSTPWWQVYDDKGGCVFDDGSCCGEVVFSCDAETRDAILELVEAHVAGSSNHDKDVISKVVRATFEGFELGLKHGKSEASEAP